MRITIVVAEGDALVLSVTRTPTALPAHANREQLLPRVGWGASQGSNSQAVAGVRSSVDLHQARGRQVPDENSTISMDPACPTQPAQEPTSLTNQKYLKF